MPLPLLLLSKIPISNNQHMFHPSLLTTYRFRPIATVVADLVDDSCYHHRLSVFKLMLASGASIIGQVLREMLLDGFVVWAQGIVYQSAL
jgi:hypothetical protein